MINQAIHNIDILRAACFAWLSILCILPVVAQIEEQTDTVDSVSLNEVTVQSSAGMRPSRIRADGSVVIDAVTAGQRMRAFGEADALRAVSTLPGVSSGSDYASGLSVDGGEFSHTFYGIGGAPVFFPYHFGGIFSVFNAEHLPVVRMEKSVHTPDMPGYLGGRMDFAQREAMTRRTRGMVNLGLIAAGASVATPAGRNADIVASARISYLNLLYGGMLRDKSTDIGYGFRDLNLTARVQPTARDRFIVNLFGNKDYLSTDDSRYALHTRFGWHNLLGACEWVHSGDRFDWQQTLYCSDFGSTFDMSMTSISADVTTSITQAGTRGSGSVELPGILRSSLLAGGEILFTSSLPQQVRTVGYGDVTDVHVRRRYAVQGGVHAAWEVGLTASLRLTAGLRMAVYSTNDYHPVFVDPMATLTWESRAGIFNLHAARYTQTLHQVGFSDIGLASNFWLTADADIRAQRATTLSASWLLRPGDSDYEISADIYYKRLAGASEYDGTIITMLDNGYDCMEHILTGDGRNYGVGMMASRVYGRLTGSLSLSYGRAQRRFTAISDRWLTAAVEQRLGCTVQLHYALSRSLSIDASWMYATGRPTTPVEALYLVGENVVSVYGERNSRTLPAYHRLDLSAMWRFTIRRLPGIDNSLIFSVLNAYGHRNVSMVTFGYDVGSNTFARRDAASLYRFLPSVAYVLRF